MPHLKKKKQLKEWSKEGEQWREEEEEGVSSYSEFKMEALGCGELALERAAELS